MASMEVLKDADGSATIGWVAGGVLYTRLQGALSVPLANLLAEKLRTVAADALEIQYFSDISALNQYGTCLGRVVRTIAADRRNFGRIVLLTRPGAISATNALVSALGQPVEALTETDVFRARLTAVGAR